MTTLTSSATIGDRFPADTGRFPMSGVQALVRLILDVRRADLATGLDNAFRLLRAMKVLRGTPLDPFGRTRVRRLERELMTEYCAAVEDLPANLTEHTLADCVRIAALLLADTVRGGSASILPLRGENALPVCCGAASPDSGQHASYKEQHSPA